MTYLKKKTKPNQHKIQTNKHVYSSFIKLEDYVYAHVTYMEMVWTVGMKYIFAVTEHTGQQDMF